MPQVGKNNVSKVKIGELCRFIKGIYTQIMYVIISATNRKDSNTLKIATYYQQLLQNKGIDNYLFSLQQFNTLVRNDFVKQLEQEFLIKAGKFIFVSPEYNGSIPGILKLFIDVTDIQKVWWGKKALLTGVSAGRAGNLRGMEHLTGILHYLKVVVHPNKLPISVINSVLSAEGEFDHASTQKIIEEQVAEFIKF
jgi:chromate reductase, NAD(P)H dehydrogenase (quinone)